MMCGMPGNRAWRFRPDRASALRPFEGNPHGHVDLSKPGPSGRLQRPDLFDFAQARRSAAQSSTFLLNSHLPSANYGRPA
jgi:hypothetical protein